MNSFIPGKELARGFYFDVVRPIIEQYYPDLVYSAGLFGPGSDVLGFDTHMSTDHNWGPRSTIYLSKEDLPIHKRDLKELFGRLLPGSYRGYSTHYLELDDEPGTDVMQFIDIQPINHRVSITNIDSFVSDYLGIHPGQELSVVEWLTIPEQKLRTVAGGAVFYDGLAVLEPLRTRVAYYPHDLWLYLLSCQWQRIGQEEPFVGRAGSVGDDLGSSLIAARLVGDLMRLAFLVERKFVPYSKWFGSAFQQLNCADSLNPHFEGVLKADSWPGRERYLGQAGIILAHLCNELKATKPLPTAPSQFHDRPFYILNGEIIAQLVWDSIQDPTVKILPRGVGKVDQITDNTDILSYTERSRSLAAIFS